MSESDFEREATQLFRNLGLPLGKDSLDFFQSDNAHKSDWKSSIRQPGPSPPRHRRTRKGSRSEKVNPDTVKENDKPLNGSNRDGKRPAALSAPPRSPHSQRRQNKTLAGEKHPSVLHFATSSSINGNSATTDHQKSEPLQSPIPAVKHSPPQRKKPTVSKDANSSTQTHTPPVQNGSYISVHENPATDTRRRSLPASNTKVICNRKPSLQILSVTTSSRSILHTIKDRGFSGDPESPSSQRPQSLLGENTHEFDKPRVLNAPRSSLRKAKGAGKVDYSTSHPNPAVQNGNHVYDRLSSPEAVEQSSKSPYNHLSSPEAVGQFSKSQYDRLSSPEAVEQSSKSQYDRLSSLEAVGQFSKSPYDRLSSPEAVGQFLKSPYDRLSSPEAIKQSSKSQYNRLSSPEAIELSPEELTVSPIMSQPPSVQDSNHIYDRLSSPETTGRSSKSPEYLSVTGRRPHPIVYSSTGSRSLHVASPSPPINEVAQNGTRRKTSIEAAKEWSPEIAGSGILSETSTERSTPGGASLDDRSVSTPTDDQRSSPEYLTSTSERQTPDSELGRGKKLTRKPSFERPSALPTMSSLASNTVQALSNLVEVLTPSVEKLDEVHFWENVEDLPVYPQSNDTENEGYPASSGSVTSPWYIDPEDMDPYEFLESQIAGLTRIVDASSPTEFTGPTLVTASTGGANPAGTSSPTAGPTTSSIHQSGYYAARLTSPATEHGVTSPASLTSPRAENGVTSPVSLTSPRAGNSVTSPPGLMSPRAENGVTSPVSVTNPATEHGLTSPPGLTSPRGENGVTSPAGPTVAELPPEEQEEEDSDDEFFGE